MLKIMKVLSMGLVATLLLIGHVQASGGGGGSFTNPFQDDGPLGNKQARKAVPDLIAEFDAPSKNLEQALYKVKYDGKYLTKDQRKKFYDILDDSYDFEVMADVLGFDFAVQYIFRGVGPQSNEGRIRTWLGYLDFKNEENLD